MLDQIASADPIVDLRVTVCTRLPADWPSVRSPGRAKLHVFQTREFIETWVATRGAAKGTRSYFVDVTDRCGHRVMLLPLGITARLGEKTLSFLDAGLADYNAPVLYPNALAWTKESARALWDRIVAALPAVDVVDLRNVPFDVDGRINPIALVAAEVNDESSHGNDLTQCWEKIEASQAQLRTIKRKWRALEKLGPVRFEVAATEADVGRFLERALVQKQRRFDETRVRGFQHDPDKLAYFREATRAFGDAGHLQICALTVGGEIVATAWSLVLGKRVYEILIGFQGGEWAKYSCGRILNLMLLRWLKDKGFDYLDHGIGDEAWKLDHCDRHVALRQLVEARSIRGRLAMSRRRLVAHLRASEAWRMIRPLKQAVMGGVSRML